MSAHLASRRAALATLAALSTALLACSDPPNAPDAPNATPRPRPSASVAPLPADAQPVPDEYIVVLSEATDPSQVTAIANEIAASSGAAVELTYEHALKGFLAHMPPAAADAVASDPRVDFVEQDQYVNADQEVVADAVQAGATWGLDRIDQRALPLDTRYKYTGMGAGVNAYIIDTGIQTNHADFGARASVAFDALGGNGQDCNGHGTHVAGTVGGTTYGVAKRVTLRAVRVLSCAGSGTWAQVIAGMNFVQARHVKPAVANMSLGGGFSAAVNRAATNLVNAGVFVAVAAGNSNANACTFSPASAAGVTTVAASEITDSRAGRFSNFGPCVSLYAPGQNITSDWLRGGTNTISGTSMASPHVAGVAALYLGGNANSTAAQARAWILANATANVIRNNVAGTPNRLLYKGAL